MAFVQAVTLPLKRLREAGDSAQVVLLVNALDESLASETAKALPRLLGDLEGAHLVVTARPDRRATGWLWDRGARMDLLADAPPGSDDVLEYLQRWLAPEGEPAAMAVLAERIAGQASGNFLYAFYVVEALRGAHVLAGLDAVAARGVPLPEGGLPGVYRDFLRRELWRDDRAWSTRFGPVLAPLAVAQDEGLTTEQLRLVAGRLGGEPLTRTAVREVTRTTRQFLDGPAPDGPFRVYHQSFADFLADPEQNPDFLIDAAETHEAIVAAYAATDPLGWDSYARRNLALHASEAGQLDHLLEDARFLLAADPARLVPYLDAARSAPARAAAAVYRQSAHLLARLDPPMRASQLELTAHRLGHRGLAASIADAAPDRPWQTHWSHSHGATGYQVLTGHDGRVFAVAVGALPDGTPVIISGGDDGTVRVWRTADGTPVGEPLRGHDGPVSAVAAGALPDGTPVIISGGNDRTVRVWRTADGTPLGEPLTGHGSSVGAVAAGTLPDGTPVIISGGGYDSTVRVWRTADGTLIGRPLTGHGSWVDAVAVGALPDGTPVIISGVGSTVRVWRTADGTPVGEPLRGHRGGVTAVAAGTLPDGTPVIISGDDDGTVRVWRTADGTLIGRPLRGHGGGVRADGGGVRAVAAGALPDGTPVIISGGDGPVRVWRIADGTPVGEPLRGHDGPVSAVAAGALPDGTAVIISGGLDGTVRVWRTADGTPAEEPLRGHDGGVTEMAAAVAAGVLPDGTPVIISGVGGTVRVWRTADGTPVGEPLRGHRAGRKRWRPGRCRTAPRSSSAAAATARYGCGGRRRRPGRQAAAWPPRPGVRGGGRGAAGRHPGHHQRRPRRHGAGMADRRRHPGRGAANRPPQPGVCGGGRGAAGRHPGHHQRQRRRHGAGMADRRRHPGRGAANRPPQPGVCGGGRGAAGRHPGHHQRRPRRHGAGVADRRRHPGRGAANRPPQPGVCGGGRGAAGRHPGHHQRQRRRHGAGVADRRRHPGRCLRWTYPKR